MTEEDTFRRLKRPPFVEMLEILKDMGFVFIKEDMMSPVLQEHGWTFDEFLTERDNYVARQG